MKKIIRFRFFILIFPQLLYFYKIRNFYFVLKKSTKQPGYNPSHLLNFSQTKEESTMEKNIDQKTQDFVNSLSEDTRKELAELLSTPEGQQKFRDMIK